MLLLPGIFISFGYMLCYCLTDAVIPINAFSTIDNQTEADAEIKNTVKPPSNVTNIQKQLNTRQRQNSRQILTHFLPVHWQEFCTAIFKFVSGSNFTAQWAVYVSCQLDQSHYWSLQEYRDWISTNEGRIYKYLHGENDLKFAFEFKCLSKKSRLSLPWPLRARYLWYISAYNCTLLDHLLEYDVVHNSTNYLRVVDYTDCDMETDPEQLFTSMQHFGRVSRDFDCGGEMTEKLVQQNVQKTFPKQEEAPMVPQTMPINDDQSVLDKMILSTLNQSKPNLPSNTNMDMPVDLKSAFENKEVPAKNLTLHHDILLQPAPITEPPQSEEEMINSIARIGQQYQNIQHQCVFRNLKYLDQSQLRYRAKHHIHFLLERSTYPVLEYFNLSHSRLGQMSSQMLQWRRYFPKMKYFDLSHNKIKYFSTLFDNGLTGDDVGVLDLRHNNITTLTSDDLNTMSLHSRTLFIDIRDNPLSCDCKLTQFVTQLKNSSRSVFKTYKYLKNMTCATPAQHKGKIAATLEKNFCTALEVLVLVVPVVLLCCFIVLLIIIFTILVKFRKEIMILAFTRLHISLPCRQIEKSTEKSYDAFIAYSEQDGPWVFDAFMPRLEQPITSKGPGFKLCIHHRDFPLGRCIVDNIIDKVQESRHTVLILSNHFLKSQWCKYEFKTAFTQSITEKKQHLIMVIKEELNKSLIDNDLKRCLKTFTYVKTDDRLFWDKLMFALSDGDMKQVGSSVKKVESLKRSDSHLNKGQHDMVVITDETQNMDKVVHESTEDNQNKIEKQDQNRNHMKVWTIDGGENKYGEQGVQELSN